RSRVASLRSLKDAGITTAVVASIAWCSGAAQPIVDRATKPNLRDRHYRNAFGVAGIQDAQSGKQSRGSLARVRGLTQVEDRRSTGKPWSECQQRLIDIHA